MVSTKHIRTIGDFMRFGMDIAVECYCGRMSVLPWLPVVMKFHTEGWSGNLDAAARRFKCRRCGSIARHLGPRYR